MIVRIAHPGLPALAAAMLGFTAAALAAQPQPGPAHHHRAHRTHHRVLATAPPAPAAPVQTANASTPAPVPNEAVTPPLDHAAPSANVAPSVFQLHYPPQGEGYVTGSSPQAMDDRNAAKATGVQATIPLPQ